MDKWTNNCLGKKGWFYPILYILCFSGAMIVILFTLAFFEYVFFKKPKIWELGLISIFGFFYFYYFVRGVQAIKISRRTIQQISLQDGQYSVRTFSGKTFLVNSFNTVKEDRDFFSKKYLQFLFPKGEKNLIVETDSGRYYISAKTTNFNALHHLLFKKS